MNQKTDVEVLINKKRYVISGYESPEYMEMIASYINKTVASLRSKEWYRNLDTEMKNVLLQINLADEYFKAQDQIKKLEETQKQSDDELFEIKHEIIKKQTELEKLTTAYEELNKKYQKAQKRMIELNTKLDLTRQ